MARQIAESPRFHNWLVRLSFPTLNGTNVGASFGGWALSAVIQDKTVAGRARLISVILLNLLPAALLVALLHFALEPHPRSAWIYFALYAMAAFVIGVSSTNNRFLIVLALCVLAFSLEILRVWEAQNFKPFPAVDFKSFRSLHVAESWFGAFAGSVWASQLVRRGNPSHEKE